MGVAVVPYPNTSAYGRKYAMSTSCQKLSRIGRCAAFMPHGVDLDIENSRPSLLIRVLRKASRSGVPNPDGVRAMYRTIFLYVANSKEWREIAESYHPHTSKGAKNAINTISGSGRRHKGDIPFLYDLDMGVGASAAYLDARRIYTHLHRHYTRCARPLFGQNAAILSLEEYRVPCGILNLVKVHHLFLMCDGAIYEARNIDEVARIRNECAEAATELGVGIEVKHWVPLPHIVDESRIVETRSMHSRMDQKSSSAFL